MLFDTCFQAPLLPDGFPSISLSTVVFTAGVMIVVLGVLAAFIWVRRFKKRLTRLTELIENQTESEKLDIDISDERLDEIGRLARALNRLGKAYKQSLAELAQRAEAMATLNFVAETINRTLDLQEVFDTSLREALKTVNWDMGAIYMWDERINILNMVSYVGYSEDVVRATISYQLGEGITGKAASTRDLILVTDLPDSTEQQQTAGHPGTQISIPLVTAPGQLLGVLNVANSECREPTGDELNLLKTVAHQIALAIDKAQLYTQASMRADELEGIVEARTEQLAQAIEELSEALEKAREADKLKSLLLSTVSHELRTPLATIKGNTSMLVEHHQQLSAEDLVAHLSDIDVETDKLTGMITDLLEMSRIEAGLLQIQPLPVDLREVLRSTVRAAQMRMPTHTLEFEVPEGLPACMGDPLRIDQIVANLLENAAKYSPPGSTVLVKVEAKDEELITSVIDSGPGIPPQHLEQIFDRFFQIKASRDAGRHGIGLGLSICRGLVEAHRGKIWVTSKPGEGAAFSFSLPVASAQALSEGQ